MGPEGWHECLVEYILVQQTTPCQVINRSQAELLMSHQLCTILDRLHPHYSPGKPLDSTSTSRPFGVGDCVYAQNYRGQPLWLPGKVVAVMRPCSYKIDLGQGQVWRCHQDQLWARWGVTHDQPGVGNPPGGRLHQVQRSPPESEQKRSP